MKKLILFGTSGCHLCSIAENIVAQASDKCAMAIRLIEKDIADADALVELYGTRIPVLRVEDCDRELCWPFTEEDVITLINS